MGPRREWRLGEYTLYWVLNTGQLPRSNIISCINSLAEQTGVKISCVGVTVSHTMLFRPFFSKRKVQNNSLNGNLESHQSLFASPSQCCFSHLFTTSFREPLSTSVQSHSLTNAHWSQILALTSCIVKQSGILFGAVISQSSHTHGLPSIPPISHVQGRERRTVVLKVGYGTHFFRLPSITFSCSSVHCLYSSTF